MGAGAGQHQHHPSSPHTPHLHGDLVTGPSPTHDLDNLIAAANPEHVHTFKPSTAELQKLQNQFRSLKQSTGGTVAEKLDRDAFHHNFAKKLKPQFIDKIFNALDWDHSGVVSFREFVMLTHILFSGTDDEKIDYLFVLYDQNGDGYLSADEIGRLSHGAAAAMRALLHNLKPDSEGTKKPTATEKNKAEQVLAQKILKDADKDHDGQINITEFKAYCKKHPEILQELAQLRDLLHHVLGDELSQPPRSPMQRRIEKEVDLSKPIEAEVPVSVPTPAAAAVAAVELHQKKEKSQSPKSSPKVVHKPPPKHGSDAELFELASHHTPPTSSSALDKLTT